MIVDQTRIYDGAISFAGGQDAGKNPVLISEDQYQYGENVVCRGGELTTRPSFQKLDWNFTNNIEYDANGAHGGGSPIGSEDAFKEGLFQGASYYDPSLDSEMFVVSIGGRLFQVVPRRTTIEITELYLEKQNRDDILIAYMVQADRFHITQDGENTPIIFDGVTARRAGKDEIFTGKKMAYGMGRIVLGGKNDRDIYFGDLFGSHEGEPGESVLKFTETNFLAEGGAASLPFTMGHIKGMSFIPQQDTSMGQGQLFVFAEKGAASFFLDLERKDWKQSKFQLMALLETGGRGHRAFTPVNGDLWFRSGDGWRTYRQARAEAKGWFQLPLSTEVGNYVDVETPSLLELGSSIHFDNRLIATTTPIWNRGRPYHKGLVSLDFDVLSSFGQSLKPSWDGHWNGIKVTQLVEGIFDGQHRAFAFGLDEDGFNSVYEIDAVHSKDSFGKIVSSVVPKSFTSQQYFNEDTILGADVWVDKVREETSLEAWYRPDYYPEWLPWKTKDELPTIKPIGRAGQIANGVPTLREGFQPRFGLSKPNVGSDASTKRDLKRAYEIHVKLQWTGNMAINRFRLSGTKRVEKAKTNQ